jgi:hypothetical protein
MDSGIQSCSVIVVNAQLLERVDGNKHVTHPRVDVVHIIANVERIDLSVKNYLELFNIYVLEMTLNKRNHLLIRIWLQRTMVSSSNILSETRLSGADVILARARGLGAAPFFSPELLSGLAGAGGRCTFSSGSGRTCALIIFSINILMTQMMASNS